LGMYLKLVNQLQYLDVLCLLSEST
jgi:hypothetical protein